MSKRPSDGVRVLRGAVGQLQAVAVVASECRLVELDTVVYPACVPLFEGGQVADVLEVSEWTLAGSDNLMCHRLLWPSCPRRLAQNSD